MGAHNAATLEVARRRTEMVRDALSRRESSDTVAHWWADVLDQALNVERGTIGTLRAWMQNAHDWPVDTLQVTIRCGREDVIATYWSPGSRRVDATRATRAVLDGSSRDYAGVTTFVATEQTYVGFAAFGPEHVQLLIYTR